uniref:Uncharacterized protein n=1 Tax=Dunaliella tertiolecta TaxID=3047 RepID=A0A7S3VUA8_DUNTE
MRRAGVHALRLALAHRAPSTTNQCCSATAGINAPHLLHATSSSSQELPEQACSTSYSIQMAPAFSRRHYWTSNSSLHTAVAQPQGGSISDQALDDATSISHVDPYAVVQPEVKAISERLRHSVSSTVPVLKQAAEYFFRKGVEGKRLRPTLVMLMASALAHTPPASEYHGVDLRPASEPTHELRRRQQRIAEIAELIHVASLLHDDVIDEASTRRGILSLNATVGNKVSILSGDFLLARASVTLGALRNTEIVELMSQILEYLVSGEIMQMTATQEQTLDMDHYLQKTYCKTASLMANCMRAVAVLEGLSPEVCVCVCAWRGLHATWVPCCLCLSAALLSQMLLCASKG